MDKYTVDEGILTRDEDGDFGIRVIIHIPIGFFMGLFDWTNGLAFLFKFYERNEDAHTEDQAWKDVFGAMVGWTVGRLVLAGLITWLVIYFVRE